MSNTSSPQPHITRRRLLTASLAAPGLSLTAQDRKTVLPPELLGRSAFPAILTPYVGKLGPRLTSDATALTAYAGTLDDTKSSTPVTILIQQPNKVRIDIAGSARRTVAFDGTASRSSAAQSKFDDDFLESLTTDTPEGFLDSVRRGAALRLLGTGFRPSPKDFPNYSGPAWDIFELYTNVPVRRSAEAPIRRYYFDSDTGLLASTRYPVPGSDPTKLSIIETRFSGWRLVNGSPLPARIERVEAGARVFALDLPNAALEGKRDDTIFRPTAVAVN